MEMWVIAILWVARLLLVLLVGLSVWSVSIIVEKWKQLGSIETSVSNLDRAKAFFEANDLEGLSSWVLQTGELSAFYKDLFQFAIKLKQINPKKRELLYLGFLADRKVALEKGLTILATIGSNAPFIGLLGTVLGIIQVFAVLGGGASDSANVMKGISEALVATAAGLFVAIPAVVSFNIFSRKLKVVLNSAQAFLELTELSNE